MKAATQSSASATRAPACRRRISAACSAGSRGWRGKRPPRARAPARARPSPSPSPRPNSRDLSTMTQSQHIMIVDDEAPAREMVGDYLKMHGFTVTLCDGGKSLRTAIDGSMPDLVVLDLNMPEEDGLSIIRDLKSRINVPVIMLTATASPIDRVVGLELGADDYVAKPCELRELMARIRSVLRRSTPAKAAAAPEATAAKVEKEQLVRFGTKWLDLEAQALPG